MTSSLLLLLAVFAAFALVFIIIPWHILGFKLEKGKCLERIFACLSIGMLSVINIIFLLAFLKILSAPTFYIAYILAAAGAVAVFRRREAIQLYYSILNAVERFMSKQYKIRVLIKNARKRRLRRLREIIAMFFSDPIHNLLVAAAIGFCVYLATHHSLNYRYYALSDLYSHTTWLANLRNNIPFSSGVYPFGMHNSIMALSLAFNMDTVTLLRFFGCITGTFLILGLYMFFTRVFRSRAASTLAICVYAFAGLCGTSAYFRIGISLPQETGFTFLFPTVAFFIDYLREKEKSSLIYFGVTLALALACHFYAVIGLIFFCMCYFAVHFRRVFKKKMFKPLVITVAIAFSVGVLPLLFGLVKGIHWEQSMGWAMGSINLADSDAITQEGKSGIADLSFPEYQALDESVKKAYLKTLSISELFKLDNIRRAVDTCLQNASITTTTLYIYIAATVFTALYSLLAIILSRDKFAAATLFATAGCTLIFLGMAFSDYLKIPNVFGGGRILIFNSFCQAAMLGIVAELLFANAFMRRHRIISSALCAIYTGGIVFGLINISFPREPHSFPHAQYEGAVNARYMIKEELPRNTWTIISPVEELPMVLGHGYHYELWEIIADLSEADELGELVIPTEHLFIYVEKYPLPVWSEDPAHWNIPYDPVEEAKTPFSDIFDEDRLSVIYTESESRRVLFGKITMWVEEYKKYFPEEMDVFYEDDEIIVYHLVQNTQYSNNLLIDYGYNQ